MTALPSAERLYADASPVGHQSIEITPKASLLLKLRSLSDEELGDLEQYLQLYERTGVICSALIPFVDS